MLCGDARAVNACQINHLEGHDEPALSPKVGRGQRELALTSYQINRPLWAEPSSAGNARLQGAPKRTHFGAQENQGLRLNAGRLSAT